MQLVINPVQFDIILASDILSDQIGGLGLAPGGNIGQDTAIFEAAHGTAPDITGREGRQLDALLLAAAGMLEY